MTDRQTDKKTNKDRQEDRQPTKQNIQTNRTTLKICVTHHLFSFFRPPPSAGGGPNNKLRLPMVGTGGVRRGRIKKVPHHIKSTSPKTGFFEKWSFPKPASVLPRRVIAWAIGHQMDQGLNECSTILPLNYFRIYSKENRLNRKSQIQKTSKYFVFERSSLKVSQHLN